MQSREDFILLPKLFSSSFLSDVTLTFIKTIGLARLIIPLAGKSPCLDSGCVSQDFDCNNRVRYNSSCILKDGNSLEFSGKPALRSFRRYGGFQVSDSFIFWRTFVSSIFCA